MADPLLDDLTPPQREAVTHRDGPMLVVAGAVAKATGQTGRHIRERGFDKQYYLDLILAVKVVDIFSNDTMTIVEVSVGKNGGKK